MADMNLETFKNISAVVINLVIIAFTHFFLIESRSCGRQIWLYISKRSSVLLIIFKVKVIKFH